MEAKERRQLILEMLTKAEGKPLTGSILAKKMGVSRQVIVGDFALLRAGGTEVYATPQGYVLPLAAKAKATTAILACKHDKDRLGEELAIIIDYGGKILDVIVEHPLYGELKANLMLSSRRELMEFLQRLSQSGAHPLSVITDGVHLHTIEVQDNNVLQQIEDELRQKGILMK